jgi:2-oxoisovalerate dehydrogenase E1 component
MATVSLPPIDFQHNGLSDDQLLGLYHGILYPRLIEEQMLLFLRKGVISKWFSGIGQEAISVGCAMALQPDEYIFTMHRNLGVFTSREVPLDRLFSQWQGKAQGFTKGRDRSFHFGSKEHHIVGMISHLGPQLSLANGVALAHRLNKEGKVSMAFTGEGGTSQGEFHEAMNIAAVWQLPVIFVIENNGYGLSTPTREQYVCEDLISRAAGYGMEGHILDGNNILEVYQQVSALAEDVRKHPRPIMLECKTFRMRGHEEASGTKYVPKELMDAWEKRDPIANYEKWLYRENILKEEEINRVREELKAQIKKELQTVIDEEPIASSEEGEMADVYKAVSPVSWPASGESVEMRMIDAIRDGLKVSMENFPELVLMGQDIAEYGGVFKATEGFVELFGKDRVRNTPLCESGIVGAALGLSFMGKKAMVEMQFADFVTCGFNQIINNLAKLHYRWDENADVVIRMPTGAGVGAGPFHSQSNEAWFAHTPGLKVVYPSNPYDAKGLLIEAFRDPNPVMFFEHKALYRSAKGRVPSGRYNLPLGKAAITREGTEATIVTYGMGVHWANAVANSAGHDIEIIDIRSLLPLDEETIVRSVKKTNRAIVLHEDTLTGGFGGEIAARIGEKAFEYLDAPVMRVASMDTPVPFAGPLEKLFLPNDRLYLAIQDLMKY